MKLTELKKEVSKYIYLEDTGVIDVSLASILANRLKLGGKVWTIVIGASSGGKSQILRPISMANKKFIKRVDDLTDNTFLSGAKVKGGSNSLLKTENGSDWSHGMLAISDMTVLMSKSGESRGTILSQFRMIFDGEMTKYSGNMSEPITWKGNIGIIAGSTPSIYNVFEEVSDMGERFIYYRMKDYDPRSATNLALNRKKVDTALDEELAGHFEEYINDIIEDYKEVEVKIPDYVNQRITDIAIFSETVRTAVHKDFKNEKITSIPVVAYPMRVALQLQAIAKAFCIMKHHETGSYNLTEEELHILDWVGYSLANEEKRACLKVLASVDYEVGASTSAIADELGLETDVVRGFLTNLSAVHIVRRSGGDHDLRWYLNDKSYYDIIRRIEDINEVKELEEREATTEEDKEYEEKLANDFNSF